MDWGMFFSSLKSMGEQIEVASLTHTTENVLLLCTRVNFKCYTVYIDKVGNEKIIKQ